jgi:hypothetical protein
VGILTPNNNQLKGGKPATGLHIKMLCVRPAWIYSMLIFGGISYTNFVTGAFLDESSLSNKTACLGRGSTIAPISYLRNPRLWPLPL